MDYDQLAKLRRRPDLDPSKLAPPRPRKRKRVLVEVLFPVGFRPPGVAWQPWKNYADRDAAEQAVASLNRNHRGIIPVTGLKFRIAEAG